MSRTIDERVVEMKFNNKDFEKNASTTISTLEKLKQKLRLDGATKGIDEINKAAGKFSLDGMGNATDRVTVKFDAMSMAAMAAIQRIVDKAMNAGEKLVKSLSVDQIQAGWDKFSKKTTSVGTMIAQGYSQAEVNRELDRLLWFTDETSYDFSAMVDSISKFTASGQSLGDSVDALEGIALWAAKSGQNASTASRAMYQLAQAIPRAMTRQDWISVMNANMDTEEFRKTAIQAALNIGTLKEVQDGIYQSIVNPQAGTFDISGFIDSLTEGRWLTSEVQMATYNKYAAAVNDIYDYTQEHGVLAAEAIRALAGETDEFSRQAFKAGQETRTLTDAIDATKDAVSSGWMKTFEYLVGDYTQATAFWSDIVEKLYDIFAMPGESRNETLYESMVSGFRQFADEQEISTDFLIEGIRKEFLKGNEGMTETFNKMIDMHGFDDSLKFGWLNADLLAKGIHNVVESFEELKATTPEAEFTDDVLKQMEAYQALDEAIQNNTVDLNDYMKTINRLSGRSNLLEGLQNVWESLFGVIEDDEGNIVGAIGIIQTLKDAIADVFPPITADRIYTFTERFKEFTKSLQLSEDQAKGLKNIFKGLLQPFKWIWDAIKQIVTWVGSIFMWAYGHFKNFLAIFKDAESFSAIIEKIFGSERFQRLSDAWDTISTKIVGAWNKIRSAFVKIDKSGKEVNILERAWTKLKDVLTPVADWILDRIVDGFELIAKIDWDKVADGILVAYNAVRDFIDSLHLDQVANSVWAWMVDAYNNAKAFVESINVKQIANDIWGWIVTAYGDIKAFFDNFTLDGFVKQIKDTWQMIKDLFAGGEAAQQYSQDNWLVATIEQIKSVWAKVAPVLNPIIKSVTDNIKLFIENVTPGRIAALVFGIAVIKMVSALTAAAEGLSSIGGSFKTVASAAKTMADAFKQKLKPNYIREFSIGIGIIAGALIVFTLLPQDKLLRSAEILGGAMIAFGLLIAGIALLDKYLIRKDPSSINKTAALIGILSGAILILAASLSIISSINTDHIVTQMLALGSALAMLVGGAWGIGKLSPNMSMGLFGLIGLAGGLFILVEAVKRLDSLSIEQAITAIPKVLIMVGMLFLLSKLITSKSSKDSTRLGHNILSSTKHSSYKGASLGGAAGLVVMVMGLLVLTSVLKRLANEPMEQIIKGVINTIPLMLELFVLAGAMRLAGKNALGVGVGMLAIAAAVVVFGLAIQMIGSIPVNQVIQGGIVVGLLLVAIGTLMYMSKFTNRNKDEESNLKKFGLAMIAVSAALLIMAAAIALISTLPLAGAAVGIIGVLSLIAMLTLLLKATKGMDGKSTGRLALVAVLVAEFAAAIAILSLVAADSQGDMIVAAASLAGVMLAVTAMLYIINKIGKEAGSANDFTKIMLLITGMVVIIAGLTFLFGALLGDPGFKKAMDNAMTFVGTNFKAIQQAILALVELSSLMIIFAAIAVGMEKLDVDAWNAGKIEVLFAGLLLFVGGVTALIGLMDSAGAVTAGIEALAKIGEAWSTFLVLALLMAALAGISVGMEKLKADVWDVGKVEALFAVLVVVISAVAGLTGLMDGTGAVTAGLEVIKLIGEAWPAFVTLGVLFAILSLVSVVAKDPILVGGLGLVFGIIELVIVAIAGIIGWIANMGGEAAIKKGFEILEWLGQTLGKTIGNFIGGIVGGIGEAITGSLIIMGSNLSAFMDKIVEIGDKLNGLHVEQSSIDALESIAAAMLIFTVSDFIEGIKKIIPGMGGLDLTEVGEQISAFVPYLKDFGTTMSSADIDIGAMKTAAESMKMLGEFASIVPTEGGLLQTIMGGPGDMQKFGEGVSAMVNAMIDIDTALKEYKGDRTAVFDEANIEGVKNIGLMFTELANAIPKEGGWAQQILGTADMNKFGADILNFGNNVIEFDKVISGHEFDTQAASTVANIGETLAKVNDAIPKKGGIWQDIFGASDMVKFSISILKFARAAISFDEIISGHNFDSNAITTVGIIGSMMSELDSSLRKEKSDFIAFFEGKQTTMSDFATGIKDMGTGIASFYDSVKDIKDSTSFINATEGLKTLVSAWNEIDAQLDPESFWGSISAWFSGDKGTAFDLLAAAMVSFAQKIKPFFPATEGMDFERLIAFASALHDMTSALELTKSIGTADLSKVLDMLTTYANTQIDTYVEQIRGRKEDVKAAALEIVGMLGELANEQDVQVSISVAGEKQGESYIGGLIHKITSGEGVANVTSAIQQFLGAGAENVDPNAAFKMLDLSQINTANIFPGLDMSSLTTQFAPDMTALTTMFSGAADTSYGAYSDQMLTYVQNGSYADLATDGAEAMVGGFGSEEVMKWLSDAGYGDYAQYMTGWNDYAASEDMTVAANDAINSLDTALKVEADTTLSKTGEYAVDGFIKGLKATSSTVKLKSAGTALAATVDTAFRARLQIDSPSKTFEDNGEYTVLGYVKGVLGSMYLAKEAAEDLGTSTVDAMAAAVSYAYAAAISDYDFRPTISPILDLEDVRAEAASMRNMFDLMPAIKMTAETGNAVEAKVAQVKIDRATLNDSITGLRNDISRIKVRVADTPTSQPDLEGAIERGFSKVSVNMDGRKVGKMNINYQNRQTNLRGKTQVK